MQYSLLEISFVIPVGIFKEPELRRSGDQNASTPKFEPSNTVELVRKNFTFVRFTVSVVIRKNQDRVFARFGRIPVWVRFPYADPQSAVRIDRHLNRVDQTRKFLLGGKQVHFCAGVKLHFLDRFFTA